MAYFVFSGIEDYKDPVACFTRIEDAEKMAELISSHTPPSTISSGIPADIDRYLSDLNSGMQPYDISLTGDGSLFEIDNGFEGVLLSDPTYTTKGEGAFFGTFWADSAEQAIRQAIAALEKIKIEA